jgi:hypothetical protein
VHDLPPPLPERWVDEGNQLLEHGAGPLFHRVFAVCIDEPTMAAQELILVLAADLNHALPSEVTSVDKQSDCSDPLAVGDEMVVRMPGPWDGPGRMVDCTETSFGSPLWMTTGKQARSSFEPGHEAERCNSRLRRGPDRVVQLSICFIRTCDWLRRYS